MLEIQNYYKTVITNKNVHFYVVFRINKMHIYQKSKLIYLLPNNSIKFACKRNLPKFVNQKNSLEIFVPTLIRKNKYIKTFIPLKNKMFW